MSLLAYGHLWNRRPLLSAEDWAEILGEKLPKRGTRRRTDRERVEAGRASLAKLPGTVGKFTRAEAAAELGCSIRQVRRLEDKGRLRPCSRFGREVTYLARDVRELRMALREGR